MPHQGSFAGFTLASSAGRSFGGPWVLRALARLGAIAPLADPADPFPPLVHALPNLAHIASRTWEDPDLLSVVPPDPGMPLHAPAKPPGHAHSYPIITRDCAGNMVCGTISIQSEPWADGIFVDGLPLTAAGKVSFSIEPGARRLSPFCQHIAFANGAPALAVTTIANSVAEASYQLLAILLTERCTLEDAVTRPRFGTAPPASSSAGLSADFGRIWIDPRFDRGQRRDLRRASGRQPVRTAVDTGLGAVLRVTEAGAEGQLLPVPYIKTPFDLPA